MSMIIQIVGVFENCPMKSKKWFLVCSWKNYALTLRRELEKLIKEGLEYSHQTICWHFRVNNFKYRSTLLKPCVGSSNGATSSLAVKHFFGVLQQWNLPTYSSPLINCKISRQGAFLRMPFRKRFWDAIRFYWQLGHRKKDKNLTESFVTDWWALIWEEKQGLDLSRG